MRRLFTLLFLLVPVLADAAEVRHASSVVTTNQTTTSTTYVDVPGAVITEAQLDTAGIAPGDTVAIIVTYQARQETSNQALIRFVHGATVFDTATDQDVLQNSTSRKSARWFAVWTVVDAEDIKMQFEIITGGTAHVDQASLVIIDLNDLAATDWASNELATDGALDAAYLDGATVTFTPTAASNWLVMSWSYITHTNTTIAGISRISRSGEAASSLPSAQFEGRVSTAEFPHFTQSVFALTNASNTFKEQSAEASATTFTRRHSKIFALNLSAFRNHAYAYTEADVAITDIDITTPTPTEIQTTSITPAVQGDVWVFADFGFDKNDAARTAQYRLQIDNADNPSGQTSDAYTFNGGGGDATDEPWMPIQTMVSSMTAAAHTLDLDASVDATTGTPAAQYRLVGAVTMELPASGILQQSSSGFMRALE